MSISQHLGLVESLWDLFRRDPTPQKGIFTSQPVFRLAETIGFWIFPGVLARFPELKVVLVEPSLGWVPFYLDQLDKMASGPYDFPALDDKPSSYFHRQMYLTFVSDRAGLSIGTNSVSTASCGPRTSSSGHHVAEFAEHRREQFEGIPEAERDLMVAGNASRLYGL